MFNSITEAPDVELNEVCPAITPTFAAELVTNGSMEAGDPPTGWTAAASTTLSAQADERTGGSGSKCLDIENAGAVYGNATQTLTVARDVWIQVSAWLKGLDTHAVLQYKDTNMLDLRETTVNWGGKYATLRTPSANDTLILLNADATVGINTRYDDISIQSFNFTSMLSSLLGTHKVRGTLQCTPTISNTYPGTQCGLVFGYADANNYCLMCVDRRTARAELHQVSGGVDTCLVNGAVIYAGGAVLKVVINAGTAQLSYNGTLVGNNATITLSGLGKGVYGWTTNAENAVGTVTTSTDTTLAAVNSFSGLLIMFDDGLANQYNGFDYARDRGLVATTYVISGNIGGGGYLTAEQLTEMQTAEWVIGNHTNTTTNLTTLTEAQQETALSACKTALDGLGLTGGAHVAYPYGAYNADTLTAMAATGMLTGRKADDATATLDPDTVVPFQIGTAKTANNNISLETLQLAVNTARASGKYCAVLFHGLVASAPATFEWTLTDFQKFIDWIVSQGIPCKTMADFYADI